MPEFVAITINGSAHRVSRGTTIAVAMLQAGVPCRISVAGEPRHALCGMGICFECRARVNGIVHRRSCQVECTDGMAVETQS